MHASAKKSKSIEDRSLSKSFKIVENSKPKVQLSSAEAVEKPEIWAEVFMEHKYNLRWLIVLAN